MILPMQPRAFSLQRGGAEAVLSKTIGVNRAFIASARTLTGASTLDVWPQAGNLTFPGAAVAMEAVSTSGNDAAAPATGAQTISVTGLATGFVRTTETVAMNGVGAVPLANNYLCIESAVVLTAGTGDTNAGVIRIQVAGGGAVQCIMPVARSVSTGTHFGVADNETAIVSNFAAQMNGTTTRASVRFFWQTDTPIIFRSAQLWAPAAGKIGPYAVGLVIPERSVVKLEATFSLGLSNAVFAQYQIIRVSNDFQL